jgi:hypothetical protein
MPPKFVRPCIPTTAKAIPPGDDWLHELPQFEIGRLRSKPTSVDTST